VKVSAKQGLSKHWRQDAGGISFAILLGIMVNICVTLTPLIPQLLIDRVINPSLGNPVFVGNNIFNPLIDGVARDNYWDIFWILTIAFLTIIGIKLVSNYYRWVVATHYGTRGETRLRRQVFDKMLSQNSVVLSKYTSGEMLSVCNSDIGTIQQFFVAQLMYISGVVIFFSISVYILSTMNPILIIIPVIGGMFTFVVAIFFAKVSKDRLTAIRQARVELNTTVQENIQGVRIIRSFATEDIEQSKFDTANDLLRNRFIYRAKTHAKFNIAFSAISQLIFFGSMIVGVYLAIEGKLSAGQLATLFVYTVLISEPFNTLANILTEFQNVLIAANRVFGFVNMSNHIVDGDNPPQVTTTKPHITLSGVRVQAEDKTIIHDIDIDLPYGKSLGVMGRTGSGKTTLIKSLMRFYDCNEGSIQLDGIDIKQYRVDDIRNLYGYVMQDLFLFSDTVYNNIAFCNIDIGIDRVQQVAKIAQAHEFVLGLQDGYDTIVGEKGVGLSGGQKQRISMARAFCKDAPILLFDDCTSALDMETERLVMNNISEHFGGRTLVIATHRASSVQDCDEILYLDEGKIVERGTHSDLMTSRGEYYKVYMAQQAMQSEIMKG
jgi:ATP-binding cassette subfamily B protein